MTELDIDFKRERDYIESKYPPDASQGYRLGSAQAQAAWLRVFAKLAIQSILEGLTEGDVFATKSAMERSLSYLKDGLR